MFARTLAVALVAIGTVWAAPMPFIPKVKKQTGPTPEDIVRSFNGTYRVVSYDYGNAAKLRGLAVARAAIWSEVVIKDGTWTQIRDIGGRKLNTTYALKIDATKPVPAITLTFTGNPDPTFFGIGQVQGNQLTVSYGQRGREVVMPAADIGIGQYRWVLERTSK